MQRDRPIVVLCGYVRAPVKEQSGDGGRSVERRQMQRRRSVDVSCGYVRAAVEEHSGDGGVCVRPRREVQRREAGVGLPSNVCATAEERSDGRGIRVRCRIEQRFVQFGVIHSGLSLGLLREVGRGWEASIPDDCGAYAPIRFPPTRENCSRASANSPLSFWERGRG